MTFDLLRSGVLKLRHCKNEGYICTYFSRYVAAVWCYRRVRERNASKESKEHYVNRKMRARPIPTPKERTTHCPKSCSVRCSIYPGICLVNFHFDLRSWRIAVEAANVRRLVLSRCSANRYSYVEDHSTERSILLVIPARIIVSSITRKVRRLYRYRKTVVICREKIVKNIILILTYNFIF